MNQSVSNNPKEEGKRVWEALLAQMGEGSGFIGAMFGSLKVFLRKYLVSFIIFALAGASVAGIVYWIKPGIYRSEMTVSYVHLEKKIYADMLQKLDELIQAGSYTSLSDILGMPETSVRELHSIESLNIKREPLVDDLSTGKVPFYIIAEVSNTAILDTLQYAIVNYLNGSEFIRERLSYNVLRDQAELDFLHQRLHSLDTLSKNVFISRGKVEDKGGLNELELVEGKIIEIYARIQALEGSIAFNRNIEVLDGFVPNEKPTGPELPVWLIYGLLVGIVVRLVLLFFR